MDNYIEAFKKRFIVYKGLGDKTLQQLDEKDLFYKPNENSNSIAIIVRHVSGNLKSRFTDFLTTDGEKPWRNRDLEFEDYTASKSEIMEIWEEGWETLLKTVNSLENDDLEKTITIRSESMKVCDALLRSLAHAASHIGQMMYIGKIVKDNDWKSLSIPKTKSPSS